MRKTLSIIGLLIAIYGIYAAIILKSPYWYTYFVIGLFLFLDYIDFKLRKKSTITRLIKNKTWFITFYILLIVATIIIEIIGRVWLNLWHYPHWDASSLQQIFHVIIIGYPFGFLSIFEFFNIIKFLLKKYFKRPLIPAIVLSTIISGFVNELPNIYAEEWIYTIPYISLEILNINIVVLIGWIFIVITPLIADYLTFKTN